MTVSLMVGLVAVPLCHHYLFFQKKIDETPLSSLRQIFPVPTSSTVFPRIYVVESDLFRPLYLFSVD